MNHSANGSTGRTRSSFDAAGSLPVHDERDLMPFEPAAPPPGPWLVFAPHPDDESFGMGGTLLRARDAGIAVDIVFMTDGARGGDGDPAVIAAARRREAAAACAHLAVRRFELWNEPDRMLRDKPPLRERVAARVRDSAPACVFIPSVLELHPDHRITARLVWEGLRRCAGFDGLVLAYDICTPGPVNHLIDITSVAAEKQTLMQRYASQVETGNYVDVIEALDRARCFTLGDACRAAEGFYRLPFSPHVSLERAVLPWLQGFLKIANADDPPLVSMIVRTRNRRKLLREALSSVTAQDYPNLELVVVNDGGEDVSDLVAEAGSGLTAHRYLHLHCAVGRSAAANRGLESATGGYFLFLDDDDWLDPPHVSTLVRAVDGNPDELVAYTGVRVVSDQADACRVFNAPFDRLRLYYDNYIPIHAALVSREVIDAGIRFDESLDVLEDWDFWLQVIQRTASFLHVDGVTANYRVTRHQGIGVRGGYDGDKRRIYARWSKTWGLDEIDGLMTRLTALSGERSP